LREVREKGKILPMLTSRDLMQLEDRYNSLRESLISLTDSLLHSRDESELLDAFRVSGQTAIAFFREEESAMADCHCPAENANRIGHKRFMHDLGALLHEYRQYGSGIPVATRVRRELLAWLYEHHRVVDHQLTHQIQKLGRSGETSLMVKMEAG
jgi:hemerythrin